MRASAARFLDTIRFSLLEEAGKLSEAYAPPILYSVFCILNSSSRKGYA